MLPKVFFYCPDSVPAEVCFVGHRQEHAADFQLGIDLPLDLLYGADQLRHVLCRQIIRLDRDKHIVRSCQSIDDQHTQGRAAVQQYIVIVVFYTVHILP